MRLLVVGAGATGGYFGGRLVQAGRDVTFLLRPARAKAIAADGLQIVSPNGDVVLHPQVVTTGQIAGPYDAVLLTVKAFALEAALADIAPAVGPGTMIVPVLNGMRQVDAITARFGAKALVGGVCKVATTLDPQGRIVQLNKMQEMAYGEMDGTSSARTEALHALMDGAGFLSRLTPHIAREMWEKWILLATLGAITCTMRGNIGEVASAPGGVAFATGILDEVLAIVNAAGIPPSEGYAETVRSLISQKNSQQSPSMYRDLSAGLPIEAEQIVGDLVARGAAKGVAAPLLSAAFVHLSVYQAKHR
ncbi:MAG: ketopantoate reductase family protein [Rhodospirillales bacterium]|nr:ketopantoate reductase family protein [Rhodospirillales bacterium]